MEQVQSRDEQPKIDFGRVYDFFLDAEQHEKTLTAQDILDANIFPRTRQTINSYIRKRWRWFMHARGRRGRYYQYYLDGLLRKEYEGGKYPREYFIAAHQTNHSQYFYQFAIAYQRYQEDLVKGRAKGQTFSEEDIQVAPPELNTDLPPEDESEEEEEEQPENAFQEDPEEGTARPDFVTLSSDQRATSAHIEPSSVKEQPEPEVDGQNKIPISFTPDEEVEEDEMEIEQSQDLDEITQQDSDGETTHETEIPHKERMNLMVIWPFGRNRLEEQLEQIRTGLTKRVDDLEHKFVEEIRRLGEPQQSQTSSEISLMLKELGKLQGQVLELSPLLSQTPVFLEQVQGHMRLLEQTFPPNFPQIQEEMATRIQTIEQTLHDEKQQLDILTTLSQLPEKLELVQKQGLESLLLLEQLALLQEQVSNLSASATLLASTPTLLEQVQTKANETLLQFAQISPLLEVLQQRNEPDTLGRLQGQVDEISSHMASVLKTLNVLQQTSKSLAAEVIPVIPSGEQKPDDLIQTRIQKTIGTINALAKDLNTWLNQHYQTLEQNGQAFDENLKQDFNLFIEEYIADNRSKRDYRIKENIPVSTETPPVGEQNTFLTDQPDESDTANDTSAQGPDEDELKDEDEE